MNDHESSGMTTAPYMSRESASESLRHSAFGGLIDMNAPPYEAVQVRKR
jgi:hypothetical protein